MDAPNGSLSKGNCFGKTNPHKQGCARTCLLCEELLPGAEEAPELEVTHTHCHVTTYICVYNNWVAHRGLTPSFFLPHTVDKWFYYQKN